MSMGTSEIQRVERIEHALFGDGSHGGVLAQMAELKSEMTHLNRSVDGINANMAWIVRLLIAGIVTALLALVLRPASASGDKNGNHISIGATPTESLETQAAEYRDFFTVEEVAERIGYSVRSIQAMCAAGEIEGAEQPEGTRGWKIPKDFKFRGSLPQTTAVSGPLPQSEP